MKHISDSVKLCGRSFSSSFFVLIVKLIRFLRNMLKSVFCVTLSVYLLTCLWNLVNSLLILFSELEWNIGILWLVQVHCQGYLLLTFYLLLLELFALRPSTWWMMQIQSTINYQVVRALTVHYAAYRGNSETWTVGKRNGQQWLHSRGLSHDAYSWSCITFEDYEDCTLVATREYALRRQAFPADEIQLVAN